MFGTPLVESNIQLVQDVRIDFFAVAELKTLCKVHLLALLRIHLSLVDFLVCCYKVRTGFRIACLPIPLPRWNRENMQFKAQFLVIEYSNWWKFHCLRQNDALQSQLGRKLM